MDARSTVREMETVGASSAIDTRPYTSSWEGWKTYRVYKGCAGGFKQKAHEKTDSLGPPARLTERSASPIFLKQTFIAVYEA
jgi:hypothetical protein